MINSEKKVGAFRLLIALGVILILIIIIFFILIIGDGGNKSQSNKTSESGQVTDVSETDVIPDEIASSEVAGANAITIDNKVVNDAGQAVVNNAAPMTENAPRLSAPIVKEDIPGAAIKITADASGIKPPEFTVKAGAPVTLVLTTVGVGSRLIFDDPTLSALELPVPGDYTMAKTFNAPATAGAYTFHQDMPGRYTQTGTMIVK